MTARETWSRSLSSRYRCATGRGFERRAEQEPEPRRCPSLLCIRRADLQLALDEISREALSRRHLVPALRGIYALPVIRLALTAPVRHAKDAACRQQVSD
jgi:hypothetical protein